MLRAKTSLSRETRPSAVGAAVPLVIGAIGHRDLVDLEIPQLRASVREFLVTLSTQFPRLPLRILTPLAEGADRLVAKEAVSLGIPLTVVLPMPAHVYRFDFATEESRREFDELCSDAALVTLPLGPGMDEAQVSSPGPARARQYAQVGAFISTHCHILLALWDGKASDLLGGTAQVVNFHHHDVMPGYVDAPRKLRPLLADDESDLVYHIVCSRNVPDGQPAQGLNPLQAYWFTTSEQRPDLRSLPEHYLRIFDRTSDFNADQARYKNRVERDRSDLPMLTGNLPLELALSPINELFVTADWLAVFYQRRFRLMLRLTHILAVAMGLCLIVYSEVFSNRIMIVLFLCVFALGLSIFVVCDRGGWHRKFLDYRALAEGMRVQFFWAAAGVTVSDGSKFTHDNFLQKQDVELGWIRNVMRVSGLLSDIASSENAEGLDLAIQQWVGDHRSGQMSYYERKSLERLSHNKVTERIGTVCLWTGIAIAVVVASLHAVLDAGVRSALLVLMAVLPLLAAARAAYAHKTADKELVRQYQFMRRVFSNARRRLDKAHTDRERREVLRALGEAALDEHAEWILMNRERSAEISKV